MSVSISDFLRKIKSVTNNRGCYLYGEAVRDIINRQKPRVFNIFIKATPSDDIESLRSCLPSYKNIKYTISQIFTIPDIFTVNMLYLDVDDILAGSINILSQQNGLRDFNKSSIRFTKDASDNIRPEYLLEAIRLSVITGFHLDPKTITLLFNNREKITQIDKREVYRFLVDSVKLRGTRKVISFLNTLGIAHALFGFNLTETSIVNHFNSLDAFEFFAVVFSGVKYEDLKNTLVDKCGFAERDTNHVLRLAKAINDISDESDVSARKFLATIEKKRIPNAVRLLNNLGYKSLAKIVKKEKSAPVILSDFCIDEKTIIAAFGIENPEVVGKLLEMAQKKIIDEPAFNNQTKILTYLNYERKKYV